MWDREFTQFSKTHRVVRYDLRGYGKSSPATEPFSSTQDLKALIDKLNLTRPVIVGPSMGARIALDFALDYPAVASGLLLMAPGPPSGLEIEMIPDAKEALEADERASKAASAAWSEGKLDQAVEHLRGLWCSALRGESLEKFRGMVRANAKEVFEDRSAQYDQGAELPAVPRLSSLRAPVLILVGDQDGPLNPHFARFIADRVSGARLQVVAGGDHLLNLSRPEAFNNAFREFLARPEVNRPNPGDPTGK
jgi:3-oxoadipate enol-lactonase